MKNNYDIFKKLFTLIDNAFGWFQNTKIGKYYLKGISFNKIFFSFGFILVAQISAYTNLTSFASKIDTQLSNSEGWIYVGWFIFSWFVPEGNLFLIAVLILILAGAFIIKFREPKEKTIEDILLKPLREKAKNILFEIQTSIQYNHQKIVINRDKVIENITHELKEKQIIVLSGVGGVGKTSVIKQISKQYENKEAFYIFKASEFKNNDLLNNYSLQDFTDAHVNSDNKILVIDSAEKLFDNTDDDFFKEFLSALLQNEWKIIFTIRDNYLDILNYQFIEVYEIKPFHIHITNLTSKELLTLSKDFKFTVPTDDKLITLIKNPFYLHKYLQFYDENKNINYKAFKDELWDRKINNANLDREECFLNLAFKRANEGQFFIDNIKCKSNSLKQLKEDGILGKETAGYFITHDIYEEWALEKIIEKEFINRSSNLDFFEKIGSSLPIRRSFRNWVSEKLLLESDDIKPFIEEIIDDNEIELFWRDEIFVSILLSDYSNKFFEKFERELLADDYALLKRISFLLRLACKEADDSIFGQYGLNINAIDIFSLMNQPKGNGWKSFISFVHKHIDDIKLKNINTILPVLYDWNLKNKKGKTTRLASLIVLKYYKWINQEKYSYDQHIQKICNVIIGGTIEIQKELKFILDEVIKNKWKDNRDNYYELSVMILSTSEGLPRAFPILQNMPECVYKLADLFWTKEPEKQEDDKWYSSYDRKEIETSFGLEKYGNPRYFPDSALQTPFYYFLMIHQNDTIGFIIDFVNKCVEKYSQSDWEEVIEVEVNIDSQTKIKQYHSQALWNMYRGTSSPVMPDILKSIHMALEKHILEVIKNLKHEDIETLLKYLLIKSKSSSITAIVASAILAHPDKTFNIAKILFKTKEFIQADLVRQIKDYSEARFLYGMGYGLNNSTKVYADERLKTCEDKHRESHLESLFLNYQMFRSEEVSEEEADNRQKELWNILDNYYEQLPPKDEQVKIDKTWQMFLSRMDKRKMDIQVKKVENGLEIEFKGQLTPELEKYSKTSQKENSELLKYTSLTLWSKNKLENNQDYKKYKEFEETPLLALEQLKELVYTKPEERSQILQKEIFSDTSIVLLRDFSDILEIEDKNLCKDIILEFASMPFQKNYNYQISDGSESAISNLPLVLNFYHELRNDIKIILLLNLFRDYEIGMSGTNVHDYAMDAIVDYYNEKEIENFILGYLFLKPKYDVFYRELRQENYRIDESDVRKKFFEEYNNDIEKFMDNKIEIEDINLNMNVYSLSVIMKFVKYPKVNNMALFKNVSEQFILKIFQPKKKEEKNLEGLSKNELLEEIFSKTREEFEDINLQIKQRFFDSFPYLIYKLEDKEIQKYLQPLLDNFRDREDISYLLLEFIKIQDREDEYNKFWYTWELFEDKIVEMCKDGEYAYTDKIIQTYLLAWSPYGDIWNEKAKDWHTLKERDKRFFKRMSQKIGHCPSALYSISKLLRGVGSSYLNDGVAWISKIVKNNPDLPMDKLESNIIFNLEIITRKYILQNSQEIKKKKVKRDQLLEVLDFLVEKGSAIGYKLRDIIL